MLVSVAVLALAGLGAAVRPAGPERGLEGRPLVIAHRGASGYLPEHTLEAYALAYGLGADVLEPDVVLTRDGVAVCSHDVTVQNKAAMERAFPTRKRADGKWYFADFDLAELKGLNAAAGRGGDGLAGLQVATLDEMLGLVERLNKGTGRKVEVIPEIKDPEFHAKEGKDVARAVVEGLAARGYRSRGDGAIVQCFDLAALKRVRRELKCELRLVYLVGDAVPEAVLEDLAGWADGIGPSRKLTEGEKGAPGKQPDLIERAAAKGLKAYPYTFDRDEVGLREYLTKHAVAGFFTDFADSGRRAVDGR